MKLIKTSIVFVFLLSLLSAGVSVYLSSIRENEKEKRIYLEGVRSELESHIQELEGEKTELQGQVSNFEAKNRDLTKQLNEEKENRARLMALVQEKDLSLEGLRSQVSDAQKAFENAQKRNQELERILDELEARMREVENQKTISTTDQTAGSFVEVSVTPANLAVNPSSASLSMPQAPEISAPQTLETSVSTSTAAQPVTPLPTPPKRRRFFPFLRSSSKTEISEEKAVPQTSAESQPPVISKSAEPTPAPAPSQAESSKLKIGMPPKTDQRIAGGNVLLVNRKYNFIVINLGSRQGIGMNDVLSVQHKGAELAKVRIEKLYDDYAAAYIVEEQSQQPIGEGDVVTAV